MIRIYLDGWLIEVCFSPAEVDNAVAYWQAYGVVTACAAANLMGLQ